MDTLLKVHLCCSVTELCSTLCEPMDCSMTGFPVLHHLPKFAQTQVHWWCCSTISASAISSSFCLRFLPASGSFPISWLFTSGGQNIRASTSCIHLSNEYSGLISLRIDWFDLSAVQGTLKVFSSTTVWKHQFFGVQPSLSSKSHILMWLLDKL